MVTPYDRHWLTTEIEVQRVGGKAAHDYAEVFDGVPSQHDGKDAAVVAELAALGKGRPWPYEAAGSWEEELTYWVEEMVTQRQVVTFWQGRLEGLVARHWPEASQVLKLSSGTLLRILKRYGSPQALAADPQAPNQLARWGGALLSAKKIDELLAGARLERGCALGPLATASDPGVRREGTRRSAAVEPSAAAIASVGSRDIRFSKRKERWWVYRRRVCCGCAQVTRGSLIRRPPIARRWV